MSVVNLSDYKQLPPRPRVIRFSSPIYHDQNGVPKCVSVPVVIQDGDVLGVLEGVKRDGFLLNEHEGVFYFLPWPCAIVEIADV